MVSLKERHALVTEPSVMQRQNISENFDRSEHLRGFRSFKTRYISWFLPAIVLVGGLLTLFLVWLAQGSLLEQSRQNMRDRFQKHGEHLRMIVLSGDQSKLEPFLDNVVEAMELHSISIQNESGEVVASRSSHTVVDRSGFEVSIPLNIRTHQAAEEKWQVLLLAGRLKNSALIDNFLVYQLLILIVMAIGSVTGTFIAFDHMVGVPVNSLKLAVKDLIMGREDATIDFFEPDELGEVAVLFNHFIKKRRAELARFREFSIQSETVMLDYDSASDLLTIFGQFPESSGINLANVRRPDDLFSYVRSDHRGEIKQKWFDFRQNISASESGSEEFVFRLLRPNDEFDDNTIEKWLQMTLKWENSDNRLLVKGFLRDISLLHKREVELNNQAESFRRIYQNSPVGIWRCACNKDKYIYMNQTMAVMLGYKSPEEAIESVDSISQDVFLNPGEKTFFLDELKKHDKVGNFEFKVRKADGTVFWGAMFGRLFIEQGVQYCEGSLIDITERKLFDEQLRNSEEFYRQGLEASGIVLWQLEPASGKLQLKGAITALLGTGVPEITSLKLFQRLIHPEDLTIFSAGIDKLRRSENSQTGDRSAIEFRICRVDHSQKMEIRWLTVSALRSEIIVSGRQGHVQGVFVDITSQKEVELKLSRALEQAKSESRQKSDFFAGVSHEVRTPLNAIIGFSELLLPMVDDSRGQSYLASILSSSRSLIGVLNSMLDLSRLEAGKVELVIEAVRVGDLIGDIRQLYVAEATKRGLDFKTDIGSSVPPVLMLDEFRLRQVITAVLSNSFKYTSKGGISLEMQATPCLGLQSVDLTLTIQDTGQGIHSDDLKDIFNPFKSDSRSKKHPGAGLGLAICHHLVGLMNGRIKVKSEIQCGTRFDIILRDVKIAEVGALTAISRVERQQYHFENQRILVADDAASNRELMSEAMRGAGLQVFCAADGEEALELARKEKPQLIFMDIRMPRKDGATAARELRSDAELFRIPIVAVTASASAREQKELADLFDSFIYKPVSLARLFAEAARFLKHDVSHEKKAVLEAMNMPPEALEQLNEPWMLVDSIDKIYMPKLKELEGAIVVENVIRLADSIKNLSVKHFFNHLTIEAEKLSDCAEKFDLEGIDASKKRLAHIFNQVLTVYSRKTNS